MPTILEDKTTAWIDSMPGAGSPIHVKTVVEVPTGGWSGSLIKAEPQGINPEILLLDVDLVRPSGNAIMVISYLELRFDEKPAQQQYSQVQISLEGETVTIAVGNTQ